MGIYTYEMSKLEPDVDSPEIEINPTTLNRSQVLWTEEYEADRWTRGQDMALELELRGYDTICKDPN